MGKHISEGFVDAVSNDLCMVKSHPHTLSMFEWKFSN